MLNQQQKKVLDDYVKANATFLTTTLHSNANTSALKRDNYTKIKGVFEAAGLKNMGSAVITDAGSHLGSKLVPKRVFAVEQPPDPTVTANRLKSILDESAVHLTHQGVQVHMDTAQKKHQHPDAPIGTRLTKTGNQFYDFVDEDWHRERTLVHAGEWARLLAMAEGDVVQMGQATPRTDDLWDGGIHFEGFCLFTNNTKYVSFHCYPADDNAALLWRKGGN